MGAGGAGRALGWRVGFYIAAAGAVLGVGAFVWPLPASGAPPPMPWVAAPRDMRHANQWVVAGELASRQIGLTHPRVLFVGDSITQWWQRFGTASWDSDFAPLGAADDGVAGDTTSNVLARVNNGSLAGARPLLAVVLVGTNNIQLHQSPADIARGILAVVDDLHHRLPGTRLLLLAVLPRGDPRSSDRRAVSAIDRLLSADVSGTGVTYLDLGSRLLAPGGGFLPGVMNPDLLHPAAPGYAALAAGLQPVVGRLISS